LLLFSSVPWRTARAAGSVVVLAWGVRWLMTTFAARGYFTLAFAGGCGAKLTALPGNGGTAHDVAAGKKVDDRRFFR
jgi:hypothetical protein